MKYIVTVENGKPMLASSKNELNRIVTIIKEGPSIACVAWGKNTPADVMATVSQHILGREKSMLVGLRCVVDGSPLDEVLWEEFEKVLS